jgi:hypothetical protein
VAVYSPATELQGWRVFGKRKAQPRADAVVAITKDDFLWAIGSLCQINRVSFDASLVAGQFPGPYSTLTLIDAAARLGLRCALHAQPAADAQDWSMPGLVLVTDPADHGAPPRTAILVGADASRAMLFFAGQAAPTTLTREEFAARYAGVGMFATRATTIPPRPRSRRPSASAGSCRSCSSTAASGATCCSPLWPSSSWRSRPRCSRR